MRNLRKNFKLFVLVVGVVLVWRGIWGLSEIYLFPEREVLSLAISIILGIIILSFNDGKLNELY